MKTFVDEKKIARPVMNINITKYMLPEAPPRQIQATLTGYISWKTIKTNAGDSCSHFVSVTKSQMNDHFFLSDDITPESPKDLGTDISDDWFSPTWLFY